MKQLAVFAIGGKRACGEGRQQARGCLLYRPERSLDRSSLCVFANSVLVCASLTS